MLEDCFGEQCAWWRLGAIGERLGRSSGRSRWALTVKKGRVLELLDGGLGCGGGSNGSLADRAVKQ